VQCCDNCELAQYADEDFGREGKQGEGIFLGRSRNFYFPPRPPQSNPTQPTSKYKKATGAFGPIHLGPHITKRRLFLPALPYFLLSLP